MRDRVRGVLLVAALAIGCAGGWYVFLARVSSAGASGPVMSCTLDSTGTSVSCSNVPAGEAAINLDDGTHLVQVFSEGVAGCSMTGPGVDLASSFTVSVSDAPDCSSPHAPLLAVVSPVSPGVKLLTDMFGTEPCLPNCGNFVDQFGGPGYVAAVSSSPDVVSSAFVSEGSSITGYLVLAAGVLVAVGVLLVGLWLFWRWMVRIVGAV